MLLTRGLQKMRLGPIILLFFLTSTVIYPAFSQRSDANVLQLSDSSLNELASDTLLFLDSLAGSINPFFNLSDSLNPQNSINPTDSNEQVLKFSIYKQDIENETSMFNSLIFVNKTTQPALGKVELHLPNGWSHLASQQLEFTANPGDTVYIPTRLIAPKNLEGGRSYIIGATVSLDNDEKIKAYAYVRKTTLFDLSVVNQSSSVLINPLSLSGETGIRLVNQGNINEQINISFKHSPDYILIAPNNSSLSTCFELKAKSDTLVFIEIKRTVIKDTLFSNNPLQDELSYRIKSSNQQIEGGF